MCSEVNWCLLRSSSLWFESYHLIFWSFRPKLQTFWPGICISQSSLWAPSGPLLVHEMIFGGTWTNIFFYFNSHVFILMCVKICISSTSNPCFNGYNKVSCINTALACLLFSSLPAFLLTLHICLKLSPFRHPILSLFLLSSVSPSSLYFLK